jgi:hypothetical protein
MFATVIRHLKCIPVVEAIPVNLDVQEAVSQVVIMEVNIESIN